MVKVVTVKPGLKAKPHDSGVRNSVGQMGGCVDSSGLNRLSGGRAVISAAIATRGRVEG
jgi:hypothetical protein